MNKCKRYPECECYNDWDTPAKEIDPANAELFVTVMQEIKTYLGNILWVEYEPVLIKVKAKLQVLPHSLHGLFIPKVLSLIEFKYSWKMPARSDLAQLRSVLLGELPENKNKFQKEKEDMQMEALTNNADVMKLIMERSELSDFLSVPAPDILHKNAFWHDENDKSIDCNIYHPKYGYPGFKTYSNEIVAASFNTRHSYKDYDTGERIYAPYYLQMLCSGDGINFTNKDGKKVIKVDFLQTHLKRLAENEQDFELIYQREFTSKNVIDKPQARLIFWQELAKHLKELIALNKKHSNYKDNVDINLLTMANEFLEYGESKLENLNSANTNTKNIKSFPDYLLHENRRLLADRLKAEFTTEKGKGIRLLIEVLQRNEPQLLNIENRQRKAVFNAIKNYFDRNIGTYNSVFTSYIFDVSRDRPDFNAIKAKVEYILNSISKQA